MNEPQEKRSESRFTHGFEAVLSAILPTLNDADLNRLIGMAMQEVMRRDRLKANQTEMQPPKV